MQMVEHLLVDIRGEDFWDRARGDFALYAGIATSG
jgi:hypothetical protein